MADELTPGEISRTFKRQDEAIRATNDRIASVAGQMVPAAQYQIAHEALIERVARVESDVKAGFERVERTSQERKRVLEARDAELSAAVKAVTEGEANRARGRTSSVANWIAASGVVVAVGLLIATLLTSGGR